MASQSAPGPTLSPAAPQQAWWVLGVIIAVVAQCVSNLGTILQRKSHLLELARAKPQRRPFTSQPVWWIGMLLIISGSVSDFVALTLAPQALVATLGCLTLVAQALWAPLILGETMAHTYLPTGVILLGVVLAVAFGPHTDLHLSSAALLARFTTSAFIGYACTVVAVSVVLWLSIRHVESRFRLPDEPLLSDYTEPAPAPASGTSVPLLPPTTEVQGHVVDAAPAASTPIVVRESSTPSAAGGQAVHRLGWARYHRIAYALLAAVVGAQASQRKGDGRGGGGGCSRGGSQPRLPEPVRPASPSPPF